MEMISEHQSTATDSAQEIKETDLLALRPLVEGRICDNMNRNLEYREVSAT